MRYCCDPDFTDPNWLPSLPGDQLTPKACRMAKGDISDITWPSLAAQIMPRDAENIDLKTARIGDRIYSTVFIDLFPKEVQTFVQLFSRTLQANIPWRISFLVEADGLGYAGVRSALASILTVTSKQNRLISDGLNLLSYINLNTDDAVVRLRVAAATWAEVGELSVLRSRASMLARAIQSWGSCNVSEVSGDAFEGVVSSMVAVSNQSIANASIAPLSNVLHMLPLFRPCSIWSDGAILFRSPDGKLWPYHPGSSLQTTWIDLFYARPGSGKSVLSNAMNLAVCLSAGIQRLPRISVIDIGPSSSGLITLLKDALPASEKHKVAYHRLKMHVDYAINPFDTQLGCRYPMPQERAFLVNFLTLLATPVGNDSAYDGVSDMVGLVVDELYKAFSDTGSPNVYTPGIEDGLDVILKEMGFLQDEVTTWWEVTDALFLSGFVHEAMLAQRHAMPVLSDVASICRLPAIVDLYGQVKAPTGEALIEAFARMLSSAVREYPIIAQITQFDLGDARVVSLDLDEVAKSGGERADRQTAVMYMLARYVLARHFYLTEDSLMDMPASYLDYHKKRIAEIREDPKRIVFDEFHRTAHSSAVRNQVIQDMREGRKWKVQIALLSQSLEDFDSVMVEFATSVFIMESGPEQSVAHTAKVFGLNATARKALKTRVHGPQASGATFLAQFSTKKGENTQLLTATLGPIELWSLNTTSDDVQLRQRLTQRLGSRNAIAYLAKCFPTGSAVKLIESRLSEYQSSHGDFIDDVAEQGVMDTLTDELISAYYRQQAD
jgi:intracellular multiplication protein IcmB